MRKATHATAGRATMRGYQVTFENLDSLPRPAWTPHVVRVPAASQEEAVQKAKNVRMTRTGVSGSARCLRWSNCPRI